MVILHHLAEYVEGVRSSEMPIVFIDKRAKLDGFVISKDALKSSFEFEVVFIQIEVEFLSA